MNEICAEWLTVNQAQLAILKDEFHDWWAAYPLKVGRLVAEKEYVKARRLASAGKLLEGLERYKRTKPEYADWCHPKTWLSQGRWLDDVSEDQPKRKVAGSLQNWWD